MCLRALIREHKDINAPVSRLEIGGLEIGDVELDFRSETVEENDL